MKCDQRQDQLLAYAAAALDGAELVELEAHLSGGCDACTRQLAEARDVVASVALSVSRQAPPASIKTTLMRRIDREDQLQGVAASRGNGEAGSMSMKGRPSIRPALLAASVAAVITALSMAVPLRQAHLRNNDLNKQLTSARNQVQDATTARMLLDREIELLTAAVADRDRLIGALRDREQLQMAALLESPSLAVVPLAGQADTNPTATGRLLVDPASKTWAFVGGGLKPLPQGRTYQLWLVTADERKIPMGTFDPGADGTGTLSDKIPDGLGTVLLAAVTDEPAGGVPQPTGQFQLIGKFGG